MRSDVHFAALRAARKIAFSVTSVALVSGCSSSDGSPSKTGESTDESVSAVSGSFAKKSGQDAGPAKPSCQEVLASAFPVPGDYQWEPVAQPADVVACCDEELSETKGHSKYRWDCCVAYDPDALSGEAAPPSPFAGKHGMACTPWGPPVPPSMDRLARLRELREHASPRTMAVV